jgi:hypothetical protein
VKRHEVDIASLVLGVFFVGVAAIWGLSNVADHPRHGWWFPVLLIAVGAVGLLGSLFSRRPAEPPLDPAAPVEPAAAAGPATAAGPAAAGGRDDN